MDPHVRLHLALQRNPAPPQPKPTGKDAKEKKSQALADRNPPIVATPNDGQFGDLKTIQSQYQLNRVWAPIAALDASKAGQKVWLRGRVDTNRAKGKMCFIVLRRGVFSVQICLFEGTDISKAFVQYASKIPVESIVDVYGEVRAVNQPTKCSQSNVEVAIEKLFVVSAADALPFQLDIASQPEVSEEQAAKEEKEGKALRVGVDTRLNNRWIDLRTPASHAIFKVQSAVGTLFRQFFLNNGFIEVHTPKITPGVSEGGANVFKLDYFGQTACLAQSPQLYKQMTAACSDMFRVFEIGPVFRAENSHTHRHLCEFTGLDFEMEIVEHYSELLTVLGNCFTYIFDKLNATCQEEYKAIGKQFPFEPLKYSKETLIIHFPDAIKMLRDAGEAIGDFDDFTTPQEKKLGELVKKKFDTDFYIVDRYPLGARPFYTMPCPDDPRYTNSYDVFLRGEEITSGAQRVHEVELLKKRALECGIPLSNIAAYLESFRYGTPPHGGAGIGLERVVMLFFGLNNIRKSTMFPRDPLRLSP